MDKLANIKTTTQPDQKQEISAKQIQIENLSYTYKEKRQPILDNLNLTIAEGKKYLLLGDSAAGKSTLLNIISGLLKNYTGTIKLGGIDYAKITDTQLHQIISYVEQTPYIFTASLKWNLTLGQKVAPAKLKQVITACGIDQIIAHLPAGINTILANQGTNLSGGQKQRIALARALLRDTPVYLFDEATSSLDKAASISLEKLILGQKNKTIVLVTHHLQKETADLFDENIVLDK